MCPFASNTYPCESLAESVGSGLCELEREEAGGDLDGDGEDATGMEGFLGRGNLVALPRRSGSAQGSLVV